MADAQIRRLVGTTNSTIAAIRERTHWNISNLQPIDPVALGLCKQSELDKEVQKAADKQAKEGRVMSDDERRKLVSTEQSLEMDAEAKMPAGIAGLENFSVSDMKARGRREKSSADYSDADSFFNLPEDEDAMTDRDKDGDDDDNAAR